MRRIVVALLFTTTGASAQTSLSEVEDAFAIMVPAAYACSEYRKDPAILTKTEQLARNKLAEAGMPADDVDAFISRQIEETQAKALTKTAQQTSCMVVNEPWE